LNNSHLTIANLQSFSTENDSALHAVLPGFSAVLRRRKQQRSAFRAAALTAFRFSY
jgi:hypothetical protein